MLEIIKEIKKEGLDNIVKKYKLIYKSYGHKFLLKYHQIDSYDFKNIEAVKECRGLILSNDLEVMSYSFKRFFNIEEAEAYPINLAKAHCLFKEDGSVMTMYFDYILNIWCVSTSGTADANTSVGVHNMTFAELFFDILKDYDFDINILDKRRNYVFEMCTKYNQIVTYHEISKLVLLNVRNLDDLTEVTYKELVEISKKIGIDAVKEYDLNSEIEVRELLKNMDKEEEGFVFFDGIGRVKIKNPKYVLAHKTETNFNLKDVFKIIQENEQDEFVGILNKYKEDFLECENYWLKLTIEGYKLRDQALLIINKINCTKKDYVLYLKKYINDYNTIFQSDIFKMYETNLLFNPDDILRKVPYKKLYNMFLKSKEK